MFYTRQKSGFSPCTTPTFFLKAKSLKANTSRDQFNCNNYKIFLIFFPKVLETSWVSPDFPGVTVTESLQSSSTTLLRYNLVVPATPCWASPRGSSGLLAGEDPNTKRLVEHMDLEKMALLSGRPKEPQGTLQAHQEWLDKQVWPGGQGPVEHGWFQDPCL